MTPTEKGIFESLAKALAKHSQFDKSVAAMIACDFAEELRSRFGGYGMQNEFFNIFEAQKRMATDEDYKDLGKILSRNVNKK